MGTGSGILAVTLAKHLPAAEVMATDTSKVALEIAGENARRHGVAERVQWIECDLLAGIEAKPQFDFIVSNPPYVSAAEYEKLPQDVKDFEPREALLAGPKGTEAIERLVLQAAERLRPGGHLLIEISPMIHSAVQALLAAAPSLQPGPTVKDLARLPRVVQAESCLGRNKLRRPEQAQHSSGMFSLRSTRCVTAELRCCRWLWRGKHDGIDHYGRCAVARDRVGQRSEERRAADDGGGDPRGRTVGTAGRSALTDVDTMGRLLCHLGVDVFRRGDGLVLNTVDTRVVRAPYSLVRRMRAGFCVLGPLLARRGRAVVPLPGGCDIGDRPVDLHLRGLTALGADLRLDRGYIVATARQLRGDTDRPLWSPRPHGDGHGECPLRRRARPRTHGHPRRGPRAGDRRPGPHVELAGSANRRAGHAGHRNRRGRSARRGLLPHYSRSHRSRNAPARRGHRRSAVSVVGLVPDHLQTLFAKLDASGIRLDVQADRVTVQSDVRPFPVSVAAEPYPGLPTDLQAHWTAFMATAAGPSFVEDRVFPMRWGHVAELKRLGARLQCVPGGVRIAGNCRYQGAEVVATDLRATAALVLAALAARGTSVIHAAHHLSAATNGSTSSWPGLGARIERFSIESPATEFPLPIRGMQGIID